MLPPAGRGESTMREADMNPAGMNSAGRYLGFAMALLFALALGACAGGMGQVRAVDPSFDRPPQCYPADCRELLPAGV
jgi:hypothetical protein